MSGAGPSNPSALAQEAARLAALPDAPRTQRLPCAGQVFWLKILKERGVLLRWRKGSAQALMQHEVDAFDSLRARGLPVPQIVLRRPGYFVLSDAGPDLDTQLGDPANRAPRLATAALALADLHHAGAAHGGAHLRNMCLKDDRISFIDLEGAIVQNAPLTAQAYDLRVLIFSVFASFPGDRALAKATLAAYAHGTDGRVVAAARDWAVRHQYLATLVTPLKWHEDRFRPARAYRQYGAVPDALKLLRHS